MSGVPPSLYPAGSDQVVLAWPATSGFAVAMPMAGASGTVGPGVTEVEGSENAPGPRALRARTRNV